MAATPDGSNEAMPEEVKTGADRLLELVRRSKEVAMAAAAKELGVGIQTVEAWANFLEEDGFVAIRYKFTTPYITVPESPAGKAKAHFGAFAKKAAESSAEKAEGADISGLKVDFDETKDLLTKAAEEKLAGEFGLLKQTSSEMLGKLRLLHEKLVVQAGIAPQRKVVLNDALREVEETLRGAESYVAKGKFDQANLAYSRLHATAKKLLDDLNRLHDQIVTLQSIQETKEYKDMLGQAYQLMTEGKVEEAKQIYEKLNFAHENLAKEFVEKKVQMEEDIAKFNKDLSKKVDQLNLEKLKRISSQVTALVTAGRQFLKKGEFGTAESYYLAIKREYGDLPPGFAEEKNGLQEKILDFYSALSNQREKSVRAKFEGSVRQIERLVKETQELVNEDRIENAIQHYRQIKKLYIKLPVGFLKEKAILQEKLLGLYNIITAIYTQKNLDRLKAKSAEIIALLSTMKTYTERGELMEAEEAYQKVERLYNEMPKGFLHEETTLQNLIVQAYEAYLRKAEQLKTGSFSLTLSAITRLLEVAERQLQKSNYDHANDTYFKIIGLYSSLPKGFAARKTETRERVLHLYRSLLSAPASLEGIEAQAAAAGSAIKQHASQIRQKETSGQIITLIANAHSAVLRGNLAFIPQAASELAALQKGLPGLAKTNPTISAKAAGITEEAELYGKAASLRRLYETGQIQQLKAALGHVRMRNVLLKHRYPEDKALFDYVSSQHDAYLQKLMAAEAGNASQPSAPVALSQPAKPAGISAATSIEAAPQVLQQTVQAASQGKAGTSDIEKKIEELKSLSRATVKRPLLLPPTWRGA